jgi:serine/threonine-protein kinase RsbW
MPDNFNAELTVSNETSNLAQVREFILVNLRKTKIPENEHGKIVLAVDEAISNIIRHAYEDFVKGSRTIEVLIRVDAQKVVFMLRDSGKEFDPTVVTDPNILEHVKIGKRYGLGLFLMRRIMDEVKFVFRSGVENMLTMVKYLQAPGSQSEACEPNEGKNQ